jgi:hypothetical protein
MMPLSSNHRRANTRYSRRLSADSTRACVGRSDWPAAAPLIRSSIARSTRSRLHAHPFFEANRSHLSFRSNSPTTYDTAKSP